MALKIIWNNIIAEPTDVIVTPASRKPRIGSGLDGVIHQVAGPKLLAARKTLGTIEPGVVKTTDSFGLKKKCGAKFVIHALGPLCADGKRNGTERPLLFGCYLQILCTAVALKAKTISVPVMSSGKFGMPIEEAMDTAIEAIELFLKAVPGLEVKLVGIDVEFYKYACEKYPNLTESRFNEASVAAYRVNHRRERCVDDHEDVGAFLLDEESEYFSNLQFWLKMEGKSFNQIFNMLWKSVSEREKARWNAVPAAHRLKRRVKDAKKESVQNKYIITQKDLAAWSGVSERNIKHYLSSNDSSIPTLDTLVLLTLTMGLPFECLKQMLIRCGYPVSGSGLTDRERLILKLCAKNKSIGDINLALDEAGKPPLQSPKNERRKAKK